MKINLIFQFTFICFYSFNLINSLNIAVESSKFSDPEFKKMIDEIDANLKAGPNFVPSSIRLIFHDCISGCNGCINIKNSDNTRLKGALINNVVLYENGGYAQKKFYGKTLSRADFWVLVSMRALYNASKLPGLTLPVLDFKMGRVDCTAGATLDEPEDLPKSHRSFDHLIEMFGPGKFNFSVREIVAIMGAHSLGAVKPDTSGYDGWWVIKNTVFDNSFYTHLVNASLKYQSATMNVNGFGTKYQWNATVDHCTDPNCFPKPAKHPRMMLNTDMSLYLKFNVDTLGKPSCGYTNCSLNDESAEIVKEFAQNESSFKQTFGIVFTKLVQHGYEGKCILRDPITNEC
jgi:hypothetical protein